MNQTQTMAMKITRKTYPIALALLPGGFAQYAFDEVKGCYVVINLPESTYGDGDRILPGTALSNSWWLKKEFRSNFKFLEDEVKGGFTPVERRTPPEATPVRVSAGARYRYDAPLRRNRSRGNR